MPVPPVQFADITCLRDVCIIISVIFVGIYNVVLLVAAVVVDLLNDVYTA